MRVINKQAHTKIQKQLTRLTNSSMILHFQSLIFSFLLMF